MEIVMNGTFFSALDRAVSFVKSIRRHALILAFAGFFALTSTACSANTMAAEPKAPSSYNERPSTYDSSLPYGKENKPSRELYKATQKFEGGMNNFNDDLKYERDGVQKDAKKLVDRVETNIDRNSVNSPKDIVDNARTKNPLGDKLKESAQNIKNAVEDTADDLADSTRQGTRNVMQNTERAKDNAPRIFEQAKQNAQNATNDARETAESIGKGVQSAGKGAQDAAQRAANSAQ